MHDLDDPRGQGAQWGEVQANIHKALGCAGVITDGSVRDLDEVKALGFQFAAAHVSVSHAYVHMVDFGLPVKVGGLWVKPGDLIHADQHGAVTIPADIADKIPEAVAKVEADERQIINVCQSRDFSADKLKELFKKIRPGTLLRSVSAPGPFADGVGSRRARRVAAAVIGASACALSDAVRESPRRPTSSTRRVPWPRRRRTSC